MNAAQQRILGDNPDRFRVVDDDDRLILADGHLLVLSDKGQLLMVEATSEEYREKGSVQALEGRCWTAPALANGKLYLRNHDEMVAYDLAQ